MNLTELKTKLIDRKNINKSFRQRNMFTVFCCVLLAISLINYSSTLYGVIISVSVSFCLAIFIVKIRIVKDVDKSNKSLHLTIEAAIKEARLNDNYSLLNELLDSKYNSHVVLIMSRLPLESFNLTKLSRWVNLPSAIKYFKENNFKTEDLTNRSRMLGYMRNVAPSMFSK